MGEYPVHRPEEFAGQTPPPRIMGSETEYLVACTSTPRSIKLAGQLIHDITSGPLGTVMTGTKDYKKPSAYIVNGSRFYIDLEHFVEAADAEALGPTQAAIGQRANQRIVQDYCAARNLATRSEEDPNGVQFQVYRRTGFLHGLKNESAGYHENHLTPHAESRQMRLRAIRFMGSYLASRVVWAGSGIVGKKGFYWSQKAHNIATTDEMALPQEGHPSPTGQRKPMLCWSTVHGNNQGMEPLAKGWDRMEIRYADAPHSYWTRIMSFATASLALRLVEQKHHLPVDFLDKATFVLVGGAVQPIARDLTLKSTYMTQAEKHISALDQGEMLATAVLDLVRDKKVQLPADEVWAAEQWLQIIKDMRTIDMQEPESLQILTRRLDSAVRYRMLCRRVGLQALTTNNKRAVANDLNYDRIHDVAVADAYWQQAQPELYAAHAAQERWLYDHPQPNTRAELRAYILQQYAGKALYDVLWARISLSDHETIALDDPYDADCRAKRPIAVAKVVPPRNPMVYPIFGQFHPAA
jgi:hypothetical protein